jgi:hypothetical protein
MNKGQLTNACRSSSPDARSPAVATAAISTLVFERSSSTLEPQESNDISAFEWWSCIIASFLRLDCAAEVFLKEDGLVPLVLFFLETVICEIGCGGSNSKREGGIPTPTCWPPEGIVSNEFGGHVIQKKTWKQKQYAQKFSNIPWFFSFVPGSLELALI